MLKEREAGIEVETQTSDEIDDKGRWQRLVLKHHEDNGEFYFTLKGDCVHYNKNYTGLNFRSYELQSRRLCMICKDRGRVK